jgi:soluble lytic murein transglycosylase
MELIRKIIGDASFQNALSTKAFWRFLSVEVKLLSLFMILATTVLIENPSKYSIQNLSSINTFTTNSSSKVVLGRGEKIDLQKMVNRTMSYSYADTQLGFYLKNLRFFDSNSKLDAEQIILSNLPKYLGNKAHSYVRAVLKISEQHQVDPIWILSVMWTESNFDFSAKSWAGARGLMQIMPDTRKFIYKVYKRQGNKLLVEKEDFNINEYFPYRITIKENKAHIRKLVNIELGVIYLKTLLNSFKSHKYATVAYNMGPGWTRGRLRRKLPVGTDNQYLDKVRKAYKHIVKKI